MTALSFTIINLSSAIGAQINTLSDYELDLKDSRKKNIVQALDEFGHGRLKALSIVEFLLTFVLAFLFYLIGQKPILLIMWLVGLPLGYVYSAPPLRLKSRSWLAPVALVLVLGIFPVFFSYLAFASGISALFILCVVGMVLTVYGVIVPTEIRDYFGDKAMGIETMTVHLGLVKASLLSILLLGLGGTFMGTAFFLELVNGHHSLLSVLAFAIAIPDAFVLAKFRKLYSLCRKYGSSKEDTVAEDIVNLSAKNPQWIMLVTQTYSLLSLILLGSRVIL